MAASVLNALDHRLRQRMIEVIEDAGRINVTDIYIKLRLEQSVASQHLALLRKAGVCITERVGKNIYYSLDHARLDAISKCIKGLAGA